MELEEVLGVQFTKTDLVTFATGKRSLVLIYFYKNQIRTGSILKILGCKARWTLWAKHSSKHLICLTHLIISTFGVLKNIEKNISLGMKDFIVALENCGTVNSKNFRIHMLKWYYLPSLIISWQCMKKSLFHYDMLIIFNLLYYYLKSYNKTHQSYRKHIIIK